MTGDPCLSKVLTKEIQTDLLRGDAYAGSWLQIRVFYQIKKTFLYMSIGTRRSWIKKRSKKSRDAGPVIKFDVILLSS